jgi:signal-transduction protein with cAMP-binding, CBS, and nucleotidyltransferase domain
MSGKVFSCRPEEDIHAALNTMKRNRVRRLVVLAADGGIEGVLSLDDIAMHAQKADGARHPHLSYQDVVETFKAICEKELAKSARTQPAIVAVA